MVCVVCEGACRENDWRVCECCEAPIHEACLPQIPVGLYHCLTCKGKAMKGLFSDPTFDEDLWDFVISGMHKTRD